MAGRFLIAVKGLVRRADGRFVLIRDPRRGWEFPGGGVEAGEDPVAALEREIDEETGLAAEVTQLAGLYSNAGQPPMLFLYFLARYLSGELRPSPESPELRWVDRAEALRLITMPVVRDRLDELLGFRGDPAYAVTRGGFLNKPYRVLHHRTL